MAGSGNIVTSRQGVEGGTSDANRPAGGLLGKLAVVAPLSLLVLYIAGWASVLQDMNGLEGMVRWTDFKSTLTGAVVIADGNGALLYDLPTQLAAQNKVLAPYIPPIDLQSILPYNHLPFEALFIAPFTGLPYSFSFLLWTLLMALALAASLFIMSRTLPVWGQAGAVLVLALVSYQPLFRSFILGQNSPLVLLGLCWTYAALRRGWESWAGAALVLVAFKPQIVPVLVLLLLLQRHWKSLLVFAGSLAALCVAAMLPLGVDWPVQYVRLLLGVANWSETGAIDPAIMHNWRGFATNLFGWWAPSLVTPVFALLSLASVVLLIRVWYRTRGDISPSTMRAGEDGANPFAFDTLWALAGLVVVLTALHLNPHDLTLLIFPGWILGAYTLRAWGEGSRARLWLTLMWAGYLLIPLGFYLPVPPSAPVVPNVLIMSAAALLLALPPAGRRTAPQQAPT